ncbi:hypothetical protein [Acidovorax sp. CCYZU-2555]|uniref:hypothetical protein n=1 Tax=Acidovorax sp. CCYZU-2555 TaxID=2835042 RepID=UPI001BCE8E45|nr:hypothetical protein [Acidovorax sp. CCYZU-2555]MBS7780931.1 hypothetical protein [Acidovorax sp. CCYZU-2555]
MADAHAEHAERLLDLWCSLALRHVALGSACACGSGGVSLRLEDFELDIVDYLQDGGERCDDDQIAEWFRAHQDLTARQQPLRALLDEVLRERLPAPVAHWTLQRLERTLRSFAQLHGADMV